MEIPIKNVWTGLMLVAALTVPASRMGEQSASAGLEAKAKAAVATTQGALHVAGLQQPVHVLRDRWGVAHIYAQNQHDLFFAQGFVVAQDRLFQMELWKRSGQGRLAEILGPSALLRDINARLLRYRGDVEAEYKSYSPDAKEILQAFTSGINAFIAETEKPGASALPVEFELAGFKPERWKPEDCLNRMAAYSMTGNAGRELRHAQMVAAVGAERASELVELDPPVKFDPAPGSEFSGLSARVVENLVGSDTRIQFPAQVPEGSNNWTVSGALTQSGKPLLANDPHRVIAEPSLRYIVHLVAPGWNVIGAGEPGLPGVAAGHNQRIAWGFTIFGLDQQDLYIEELKPDDSLQYRTENGWQRAVVQKESFGIRDGPIVSVELKFTRHGPVLWEDGKRAVALRWVGAEAGTAGYLGSLALDRAQNWQQFEEAMKRWKLPSENIVYADTDGNIGEHSTGLAPLRKNWTGLLPVPGWGGFEWTGAVPNEKLPHSFNPGAGFIATANHKMIPEGYAFKVGYEWAEPYRFERIVEVLQHAKTSGHKLTVQDMESLQNDVVSMPARALKELLARAAGEHATPAERLLLDWDCAVARDSAAAALYEFWVAELSSVVTERALRASIRNRGDARPILGALRHLRISRVLNHLSQPKPAVFGANPEAERDRILRETVGTAAEELSRQAGPDPSKWTWGQRHVVWFLHPLDLAPGAKTLLDLGPVPRPGDGDTVNATYSGESFTQVAGASYREIFDLGDWDNSVGINVPGQSGQPGSAHYSDLLPLWAEGRYFPLLFSKEAIERETTARLELKP